MGSLINYEYIDFPFEKFDFSVCDDIPYKNQLELHPHMPEHVLNHIRGLFSEEELFTLECDSYYIYMIHMDNLQCSLSLMNEF